jgi:hypothetical protein
LVNHLKGGNMRYRFLVLLISVGACKVNDDGPVSLPLPAAALALGAAATQTQWCSPVGCTTCELDPTFYETGCAEMLDWCSAEAACPGGLDPLFCPGNPPYPRCVFMALAVCDESNSTWCCSPYQLGPEWYCGTDADCPAATDCLEAVCSDFWGQPNPYGAAGKCAYHLRPDGTPCDDEGGTHCEAGVCTP